jgi:hypothetical protein
VPTVKEKIFEECEKSLASGRSSDDTPYMQNTNSNLDPQSETYSFAQFTPEEHEEYQQWLAECELREELNKGN